MNHLSIDPRRGAERSSFGIGVTVERSRMVRRPWWAFWRQKIRVIDSARLREVSIRAPWKEL